MTLPTPIARRRRWWRAAALFIVLLVGAGVGIAVLSRPKVPWRAERLEALTAEQIEMVRQNPQNVRAAYATCRDELIADLGRPFEKLSEEDRQLIFCMVLAHAMAPYGDSTVTTLPDMLAASSLNCGNYPFLMIRLHELLAGRVDPPIALVGWDGGAVGNHAMGYRPGDAGFFVDPSVGIVARATLDEVAAGKRLERDRVVGFGQRPEDAAFRDQVGWAFGRGRFRASDLLFYFESLDHQLTRYGRPADWPTPGAVRWREKRR
jgi:hypothetical protein